MDTEKIFRLYEDQIRKHPGADASTFTENVDGLVMSVGRFRFVSWWDFDETRTKAIVHKLVNEIRPSIQPLIWRIYDGDGPANLSACLADHGFGRNEPGQLMVRDLTSELPNMPNGIEVERVLNEADYESWNDVSNQAFNLDWSIDRECMESVLNDPHRPLLLARRDGRAIGCATLWAPATGQFCGLLGGGVIPSARNAGVYQALTAKRLQLARARGYRYAAVDANDQSGPRLAQHGFQRIRSETTWTLDFPA